jgi:hypothetical protein
MPQPVKLLDRIEDHVTALYQRIVRLERRPQPSPIESVNTVSASGSALTLPDVTTATMHDVTLTADCTFTFPAAAAGKSFSMRLKQDGTGGRHATWDSSVKWDGGSAPTLSTAASAVDAFAFVCFDGARWEGFFSAAALS